MADALVRQGWPLLIAAVYLIGALELKRFHQATDALANAVSGLNATPASLPSWLDTLPAGLPVDADAELHLALAELERGRPGGGHRARPPDTARRRGCPP